MLNTSRKIEIPGRIPLKEGKVRTIYELDNDQFLIIATDRVSAFDVVLPTAIPYKGQVLTQISNFWFRTLKCVPEHHLIETDFDKFPSELRQIEDLRNRSVIVKKARVIPYECVVRGYISGSLWKAYKKGEQPYGIQLETGLKESSKFSEPIFTPTTKADEGHDMPISETEMANDIGVELTSRLKDLSLNIFLEGSRLAEEKGIILADTKFEFGLHNDKLILIDECLTPDSSRFWPMDRYETGKSQPSFDKQFVRDYLNTLDWDKTPPGPELPPEVVIATQKKYREVYSLLTGQELI